MTRDMAWREELRNDPALRSFVKRHEDAFDKIFKEWAISRLEHFEKRRNLGALSVEYIFQQLQQQGSITIYEYMEPEDVTPICKKRLSGQTQTKDCTPDTMRSSTKTTSVKVSSQIII